VVQVEHSHISRTIRVIVYLACVGRADTRLRCRVPDTAAEVEDERADDGREDDGDSDHQYDPYDRADTAVVPFEVGYVEFHGYVALYLH